MSILDAALPISSLSTQYWYIRVFIALHRSCLQLLSSAWSTRFALIWNENTSRTSARRLHFHQRASAKHSLVPFPKGARAADGSPLLSSPLYSRVWLQLPLRRARVLHILDVQFARTSEQQLGYFKAISLLEYWVLLMLSLRSVVDGRVDVTSLFPKWNRISSERVRFIDLKRMVLLVADCLEPIRQESTLQGRARRQSHTHTHNVSRWMREEEKNGRRQETFARRRDRTDQKVPGALGVCSISSRLSGGPSVPRFFKRKSRLPSARHQPIASGSKYSMCAFVTAFLIAFLTHSCFPHPHPPSRSGEQNKSERRSESICRDVSERKSRLRRKRRLQLRGSWRRIGSVSHSDSRRLSQTSAEHIAWARRRQQQRATAGRQSARLRHWLERHVTASNRISSSAKVEAPAIAPRRRRRLESKMAS